MKTLELNIGLHSKTIGTINPIVVLNALIGRGFTLGAYRVTQSSCVDGAEPCLAVRVSVPAHASLDSAFASIYRLAVDYGQDCIAFAGFVGPAPYAGINGALWVSPDEPLSDCQTVQAKHLAKAQEPARAEKLTREIIAGMPEIYQDVLYRAAAAQYHERNTETMSDYASLGY